VGKKLEEGLAVDLRKFLGEFSEHALVFFSDSSPRRRGNGTVSSRRKEFEKRKLRGCFVRPRPTSSA
jgi:hypothetical protein